MVCIRSCHNASVGRVSNPGLKENVCTGMDCIPVASSINPVSTEENVFYNVIEKKDFANFAHNTEYSVENNVCYGVMQLQEAEVSTELCEDDKKGKKVNEPDYY